MTSLFKTVSAVEFESNRYPVRHWERLSRFAIGNECDPRGLFRLTDDRWDAWPYASQGMPSRTLDFRFRFHPLRSFIKLYAKWYCFQKLLTSAGNLLGGLPDLPAKLARADRYILEQNLRSIDDLAPLPVFQALWDALITEQPEDDRPLSKRAVDIQVATNPFWRVLRAEFGVPQVIPPVAPHTRVKPAEFAADPSMIIPDHVVRQLTNKLALHRRGLNLLCRYEHLRLCVLILMICVGRRVGEVLFAPRGNGPDGPLRRHPSGVGSPEGALWFQFTPNKKGGPSDTVYISTEWEDAVLYCVRELVKYGDEIRHLAVPEERELLILVSPLNWTAGSHARFKPADGTQPSSLTEGAAEREGGAQGRVWGLSYPAFTSWLYGSSGQKSITELWGITVDGKAGSPAYRLLTKFARHTRHSALALDPQIPLETRQRDLNHRVLDTQFTYQHRLNENNDILLEKIKKGELIGRGVGWLSELLGAEITASRPQSRFRPGRPSAMTPRIRTLIRNNPLFMQRNRVPCGICISPLGPGGCAEYLNCTSAAEGGCQSFVVDVGDIRMLDELNSRAREERRLEGESAAAGRAVQARKRGVMARRTEELRDEAMRRATKETLDGLRALQNEVEEKGL